MGATEFVYLRTTFRTLAEDLRRGASYPDKGFDEAGWLRLFGYPGQQVNSLLG